jgi:YVTN family beta-propeller protein
VRFRLALIGVIALLPLFIASSGSSDQYLSPGEMKFSQDGRWLYVICERTDEVRVVDTTTGKISGTVQVGHVPRDLTLSPDGKQLYVSNSSDDTISVIDIANLKVTRTMQTGFEPWGLVTDRSGATLYVANRVSDNISVIDTQSGQERKLLLAGRGVSYLTLSPDGSRIYATHVFPNLGPHRAPPQSEITVIDTVRQNVMDRIPLHNVAGVFHLATSGDGKLGVAAQLRPKNLVPLAHVEHGWAFGDSITIFGDQLGTVQVPIDELDRYYALPFGVVVTPDKSRVFVGTAGSDSITVIDVRKLLTYARSQQKPFANDLSASANYVLARIPVGKNPRGMVLSPDGRRLYVGNRMDDSISVIDAVTNSVADTIDLGGPRKVTPLRRGEQIFYSAKYSFQGQFGCANCHIDATFDGLEWDLEPDGFGVDVVDNRLLEDIGGTEPFKWNGGNPDMPTECGPRTEKFFYRSQSYDGRELADLVSFIQAMPSRPNRYRLTNGEPTPAQERGKDIYFRTVDKTGAAIPESNQCLYCHSGPKYTNQQKFDVGSGKKTDRSPVFDVPQLINVAYTAPYLHDGSARSLEEIWTVFNPNDTHGRTNDLTKDELNDLVEYLRTL